MTVPGEPDLVGSERDVLINYLNKNRDAVVRTRARTNRTLCVALSVSVLGPVEHRRDGEPIPLRPGKTTEALIRLARCALTDGDAEEARRLLETGNELMAQVAQRLTEVNRVDGRATRAQRAPVGS